VDRIEPIRPHPPSTPSIPAIRRTDRSHDQPGKDAEQQGRKRRREPPRADGPPDDGRPHIDVTV
jgi:hypothetical protein